MIEKTESNPLFNRLAEMIAFSTFWLIYPRKEDYDKAYYKFQDALKKTNAENILSALSKQREYASEVGVPFLWKKPSVWLDQECWNDRVNTQI